MRTNTNITLFNRFVVDNEEKYQSTHISGVTWEDKRAVKAVKSGVVVSADVLIYIPMARGTNYLKPRVWLDLDMKIGKWTLNPGDILVKGTVLDQLGSSFTVTDLQNKYDNVVRISSVDTLDVGSSAMQHWLVGAE